MTMRLQLFQYRQNEASRTTSSWCDCFTTAVAFEFLDRDKVRGPNLYAGTMGRYTLGPQGIVGTNYPSRVTVIQVQFCDSDLSRRKTRIHYNDAVLGADSPHPCFHLPLAHSSTLARIMLLEGMNFFHWTHGAAILPPYLWLCRSFCLSRILFTERNSCDKVGLNCFEKWKWHSL